MIESLNPFLNFAGSASDALAFYEEALGAQTEAVMRWSDMPGDDVPPELADNIMYSLVRIGGGVLELSDVPPNVEIVTGTHPQIMLKCTEPGDVDRFFAALADGGEAHMEPDDMFWGARYAEVTDRFGITWALNCSIESPQ